MPDTTTDTEIDAHHRTARSSARRPAAADRQRELHVARGDDARPARVLTNKYAEGYPGKRYYGGNSSSTQAEALAIERVKALFGAEHANVQPHSGANANMAVYLALLKPGDTVMGLSLDHGGHLTHGSPVNASGKLYNFVALRRRPGDERIDMDEVRDTALEHRPKLIVAGATRLPAPPSTPSRSARSPTRSARCSCSTPPTSPASSPAGRTRTPCRYADIVTFTTHKTLRGPRGGCILSQAEHARGHRQGRLPRACRAVRSSTSIAAKAVAFREASHAEFRDYAQQIVANADALAEALAEQGFRLVSGGTDNHLMLVDLRPFDADLTGKDGPERASTRPASRSTRTRCPTTRAARSSPRGVRIGTPAVTTQGMTEPEMAVIADADRPCAAWSRRRIGRGGAGPQGSRRAVRPLHAYPNGL